MRFEVLGGVEVSTVPTDPSGLRFALRPRAELAELTAAVGARSAEITKAVQLRPCLLYTSDAADE